MSTITHEEALAKHSKFEQLIDQTTRAAVMAATEALDTQMLANFRMNTKRSPGPCGDELAGKLHKVIEEAVREQFSF